MILILASEKSCRKIPSCFILMAHLGSVYALILCIDLIYAFHRFMMSSVLFQVPPRIFLSCCSFPIVQSVYVSSASSCSIVMLEFNSRTLLCHLFRSNQPAPINFVDSPLNLTNSLEQSPLDCMLST